MKNFRIRAAEKRGAEYEMMGEHERCSILK